MRMTTANGTMINRSWLLALLLAFAVPVVGQEVTEERFRLFTECAPLRVNVVVVAGDPESDEIGLSEDRVRRMAESRLRAARLYNAEADAFVRLYAVYGGFPELVGLEFWKRLFDPISEEWAFLQVYRPEQYGNDEDAGFFMQSLSEMLDAFIGDYLRVNGEWCD